MHEAVESSPEPEASATIPDLHEYPLDDVFASNESALVNAVRRVARQTGREGERWAAHGSTPTG